MPRVLDMLFGLEEWVGGPPVQSTLIVVPAGTRYIQLVRPEDGKLHLRYLAQDVVQGGDHDEEG